MTTTTNKNVDVIMNSFNTITRTSSITLGVTTKMIPSSDTTEHVVSRLRNTTLRILQSAIQKKKTIRWKD